MNINKLIKIASLVPGLNFKEIVTYFNNLIRDYIIQQATQQLSDKNNMATVMAAVNTDGDLIFIPIEIKPPTKEGEMPQFVQEFKATNSSKIIRETDIKAAIDMLGKEENKNLSFFEILEKCKA